MSTIAGKDWYRNTFLKSDEWKLFRSQVLAEHKAKCAVCNIENASNDVHHVWYGEGSFCGLRQFVILCRGCHDKVHAQFSASSAKNEAERREAYGNFLIAREGIRMAISKSKEKRVKPLKINGALVPDVKTRCDSCLKGEKVLRYLNLLKMEECQGKGAWICKDCESLLAEAASPSSYEKASSAWKEIRTCFALVRNGNSRDYIIAAIRERRAAWSFSI